MAKRERKRATAEKPEAEKPEAEGAAFDPEPPRTLRQKTAAKLRDLADCVEAGTLRRNELTSEIEELAEMTWAAPDRAWAE